MKKFLRLLSVILAVFCLPVPFSAAAQLGGASGFRDVQEGAWYYEDVITVTEIGIMKGKATGLFDPNGYITNAEVAQILSNMQMPDASAEYPEFDDVPTSAWYYPVVKKYGAYFIEHFNRYVEGQNFLPNTPTTRSELCYALLKSGGITDKMIRDKYQEITGESNLGGWRYDPEYAVRVLAEAGVVSGDGNGDYGEYQDVTRAQCAALICRFLKWINTASGSETASTAPAQTESDGIEIETELYSITLPRSWEERCLCSQLNLSPSGYSVEFYEKQNYNAGYGGTLFGIVLLPINEDVSLYPETYQLGVFYTNGSARYNVVVMYPSDVQFSEQYGNEYQSLFNDIASVLTTFRVHPGTNNSFIPSR